jgi:hypothetical protein
MRRTSPRFCRIRDRVPTLVFESTLGRGKNVAWRTCFPLWNYQSCNPGVNDRIAKPLAQTKETAAGAMRPESVTISLRKKGSLAIYNTEPTKGKAENEYWLEERAEQFWPTRMNPNNRVHPVLTGELQIRGLSLEESLQQTKAPGESMDGENTSTNPL